MRIEARVGVRVEVRVGWGSESTTSGVEREHVDVPRGDGDGIAMAREP